MIPIKLFIDCHVFDKGFQGTRTYIKGIYTELIKYKKIEFYFAAVSIENLVAEFGNQDNVKFLKYKYNNSISRLIYEIPYLIYSNKIDYAHFQYRVPPVKLCKYLVTTHDVLFEDFPEYFPKLNRFQNYWTYKVSAKMADIVFTVSKYSQEKIKEHLNCINVIITPNAIENVYFESYNKIMVKKEVYSDFGLNDYCIYISRWEPRKNHQLILEGFIRLNLFDTYSLVFIGDTTFQNPSFIALYETLSENQKNKIYFFKNLESTKMLSLLRGASFSIYPSIAEGFGIPPLEAVAANIPTICSNKTAMSEYSFFKEYAFDPSNKDDFNRALELVVKNGDINISQKSSIIKKEYNWELAAKKIYEAIINH